MRIRLDAKNTKIAEASRHLPPVASTQFEQGQIALFAARSKVKLEHWKEAFENYKKCIECLELAERKSKTEKSVKEILGQALRECGDVLFLQLNRTTLARMYYLKAQAKGDAKAQASLRSLAITLEVNSELLGKDSRDLLVDQKGQYPIVFFDNPAARLPLEIEQKMEPATVFQLVQRFDQALNSSDYAHFRELAFRVIEEFAKKQAKTPESVIEVTLLATVSDKEIIRHLLEQLVLPLRDKLFLHPALLDGLATVLKNANPSFLSVGDLETVLQVLLDCFEQLTELNGDKLLPFLMALSRILDAMVDCEVKGLRRIKTHKPLYEKLKTYCEN